MDRYEEALVQYGAETCARVDGNRRADTCELTLRTDSGSTTSALNASSSTPVSRPSGVPVDSQQLPAFGVLEYFLYVGLVGKRPRRELRHGLHLR